MTKYDSRLALPFDFVCKILDVSREDFASLAISNLLDEELDFIKNNGFHVDFQDIKKHNETVKTVKFEANGWVINKKT
ncbi:MAG: hypothetical protein QCH99_00315 [Candidatus Bathyarchaeota archaeon]|nr:hypothetical protein [Candidatus Bathyarchaeum tardum]